MTILDKIVAHKREEVAQRKDRTPVTALEKAPLFDRRPYSLRSSLLDQARSGIIAEFKRRSPSKGDINPDVEVKDVTTGYVAAGVSGLSVLTDTHFFGGAGEDLAEARRYNERPILRKDFMIDEYQIFEAKAMGADVILLIAECLSKKDVQALAARAKDLGLEVLMEVHSREQLEKLTPDIDVVGVNNRNLKDFTVSIQTSIDLYDAIPPEVLKISESGINDPAAIVRLKKVGFQGFLIGEYFMTGADPGAKCRAFTEKIHELT